jgi:multidrug efflux system membrane fusion protein
MMSDEMRVGSNSGSAPQCFPCAPCVPGSIGLSRLRLLSLFLPLAACTKAAPPARPPVAVTVATAERGVAPYLVNANGLVEPVQTVAVQSQVGGVLTGVRFREGDEVKEGDVLLEIDPRPFKSALDQAQAVLARDEAQAGNARRDADRYAALVQKDYVTRSQADQAAANATAQQSVVAADRAALDNATFNLDNATIRAPISGKTGSLLVRQGNLVKPGANPPLVVINQIHPILVRFTVPDRELPNVQKYAAKSALRVRATPRGDAVAEEGKLSFVDNGVDTTSGTVTLKARFENRDGRLWPGQFVAVEVELFVDPSAVLVPSSAVQVGQDGPFVFTVSTEGKAQFRNVTTGRVVGDRTVIEKGVEAGTKVVTDGQSRLVPDAHVEIRGPAVEKGAVGGKGPADGKGPAAKTAADGRGAP